VPGTPARLGVFRNGQEKTITITLGKYPRASAEAKAEEQKTPGEATVVGLALAPASSVAAGEHGVVSTEISRQQRAQKPAQPFGEPGRTPNENRAEPFRPAGGSATAHGKEG